MRKVCVILLAVLMFCTACEARARFVTFPAVGLCTGTYVRYRMDPGTDAEAFNGRLNTGDPVIVIGQTAVNGQVWYEIDNPEGEYTAFVFGKYIEPMYTEESQRMPMIQVITEILQNYGITRKRSELYNGPKVRRQYTKDGVLCVVDAQEEGCYFGEITIGDDTRKLRRVLGDPDMEDDSEWEYRYEVDTILRFMLEDGKITRMIYEG